ncbi:MAG: cytochrome P450 [Pseudomonadales bacterium]
MISPTPPIVKDDLPHIGAGLRFAHSPTEYLQSLREEYGDEFFLDVFGYQLFCVFSPVGLASLYAAAEEDASFGMATYDMMGFKTPMEIFLDADIDLFYDLLAKDRVSSYLKDFDEILLLEVQRWGDTGELDVFDAVRTLEQRIGFQVWMGQEAASDTMWHKFKQAFDVLSQENAFVNPQATLNTLVTNKAEERQALAALHELIGQIVDKRESDNNWPQDTLSYLYSRFDKGDSVVTRRKLTHNLVNANQGFLSNLYAAVAWTLINACRYPQYGNRLRQEIRETEAQYGVDYRQNQNALDSIVFCEQMLMESTRMAQRSLTLRKVIRETSFQGQSDLYTLQPGIYIATMLSVTNTQTEELAKFDPDHYQGRRLSRDLVKHGRETVSTFGHGRHACPAQKFSHNMCKVVLSKLLSEYEFDELSGDLQPSSQQMGGVSRTAGTTNLRYRRLKH